MFKARQSFYDSKLKVQLRRQQHNVNDFKTTETLSCRYLAKTEDSKACNTHKISLLLSGVARFNLHRSVCPYLAGEFPHSYFWFRFHFDVKVL